MNRSKEFQLSQIKWDVRFWPPQDLYVVGYITIRSPYTPYSIYLRGTIGFGFGGSDFQLFEIPGEAKVVAQVEES